MSQANGQIMGWLDSKYPALQGTPEGRELRSDLAAYNRLACGVASDTDLLAGRYDRMMQYLPETGESLVSIADPHEDNEEDDEDDV